jgi:hypothetical protein
MEVHLTESAFKCEQCEHVWAPEGKEKSRGCARSVRAHTGVDQERDF